MPDAAEHYAAVRPHPDALLPQQRKLEIEQLFKLESALRPAEVLHGYGEMNVLQREGQRDKPLLLQDIRGERFLQRAEHTIEERSDHLLEEFVGNAGIVQLLGAGIDAHHHADLREFLLRSQVDLRMDHVPTVPENRGLAENDVFRTDLQFVLHPFQSFEKDQVDGTRSIGELGHQPHLARLPYFFDAGETAAQLDPGRGRVDLPHAVKAGAIHITKRKGIEKVAEGTDPQFFIQEFRPLRPYARQILDIAVQNLRHSQI